MYVVIIRETGVFARRREPNSEAVSNCAERTLCEKYKPTQWLLIKNGLLETLLIANAPLSAHTDSRTA